MKRMMFVILIGLLWSCVNKDPRDLISTIISVNTKGQDVRKYLNKEIFLDVDVASLLRQRADSLGKSGNGDDFCKMKAAIHRFYSDVKIKDGKYVCSLKNAREINISDRLFSILQKNLDEGNSWIEKCRKEGKDVMISEIDEAYLNSLLE